MPVREGRSASPGDRILVLAGGILLFVIYVLTMAPTLSWAHHGADGGDLVRAVAKGGIPHPPGFPTYVWLGELFVRLPLSNPAWRLNLMSGVAAAGAAGLTMAALRRLCLDSSRVGALCAGLCLGLAPLLWSQALIVEVYTLAAFFVAAVVLLVVSGAPYLAQGLVWGVGMGAHPTLVFLAPLVIGRAVVGEDERRRRGDGPRAARRAVLRVAKGSSSSGEVLGGAGGRQWTAVWRLLQLGLAALVGWGAMYGPGLLARTRAPSPWADLGTLDGWWALVSGRLYRGTVLGLPAVEWPRRLLAWSGLMARQFTPVGALGAGIGWFELWRERRWLAATSLAAFVGFSVYAMGHDTVDSLVYLVPALPLAALWLGAGVDGATEWLRAHVGGNRERVAGGISVALLFLVPLLQTLFLWGAMDLSGDRSAMAWAERTLEEAPANGVLVTESDAHTFTLWYAVKVLGMRSDVVVIDTDLWYRAPYREQIADELDVADVGPALTAFEAGQRTGRPVVSLPK